MENYNIYPYAYRNPDCSEAEHLTQVAYHLIEAGYGDDALPFINTVCALFENVPLNSKLKNPAKVLGCVSYLPAGLLRIGSHSNTIDVPAPAYVVDIPEKQKDRIPDAVIKRGLTACQKARIGWFATKQVMSVISEKPISTAEFRPAVLLKKVISICDKYDPNMQAQVAEVLALKLWNILDRNPLRRACATKIQMDFHQHGQNPSWYPADPVCGFRYLTEAQTNIAADIITRDTSDTIYQLSKINGNTVMWDECTQEEKLYQTVKTPPDELQKKLAYFQPPANDNSERYKINNALHYAIRLAIDVNNLQRCHAALLRTDDKYLAGLLKAAQMVDESLVVPHDLWRTAGIFAMSLAYQESDVDDLIPMGIDAMRTILEQPNIISIFDSDLLHPIPAASKNTDSQTETIS